VVAWGERGKDDRKQNTLAPLPSTLTVRITLRVEKMREVRALLPFRNHPSIEIEANPIDCSHFQLMRIPKKDDVCGAVDISGVP
jgi:hypothetical protein